MGAFLSDSFENKSTYLSNELKKIDLPAFIDAIYTVSVSNDSISKVFYQKASTEMEIPLFENLSKKYYVESEGKSWLVKHEGFGKLVVQLNSEFNKREEVVLEKLYENYSSPRHWKAIEVLLKNEHRQIIVEYMTFILQYEFLAKGNKSVKKFESIIKSIPNYKYFAIQNPQQEVVYEIDLDSEMSKLPFWSKSSSAVLLIKNEYERNNEKIFDITYPVYFDNEWHGVIRFGFN